MNPSTFIKVEKNSGGITIAVTRPREGELSDEEILGEIGLLDSVVSDALQTLTGVQVQELGVEAAEDEADREEEEPEVEEEPEAEEDEEEEEPPKKSKKKVTKKKTSKKKASGKAPAKLSKEKTTEILAAVENIAINSLYHDPDVGEEGYVNMPEDEFEEKQQDFLQETLDGKQLSALSEKQGQVLLSTLQEHEMFDNGYYVDGEFVEQDEEEEGDEE